VFFRQNRLGFNNLPFPVYKFRTMRTATSADETLKQAKRKDSRVTKVGAFLRKSSLDELPQLLNVLRSEMSLVGRGRIRCGARRAICGNRAAAAARTPSFTNMQRATASSGHHRLAQISGYRGETAAIRPHAQARGARYLLHRPLVAVVRHQDHSPHLHRAVSIPRRLLGPDREDRPQPVTVPRRRDEPRRGDMFLTPRRSARDVGDLPGAACRGRALPQADRDAAAAPWSVATIRPEHPRLFLDAAHLARLRAHWTDPAYASLVREYKFDVGSIR